jgi:hypothetical protein
MWLGEAPRFCLFSKIDAEGRIERSEPRNRARPVRRRVAELRNLVSVTEGCSSQPRTRHAEARKGVRLVRRARHRASEPRVRARERHPRVSAPGGQSSAPRPSHERAGSPCSGRRRPERTDGCLMVDERASDLRTARTELRLGRTQLQTARTELRTRPSELWRGPPAPSSPLARTTRTRRQDMLAIASVSSDRSRAKGHDTVMDDGCAAEPQRDGPQRDHVFSSAGIGTEPCSIASSVRSDEDARMEQSAGALVSSVTYGRWSSSASLAVLLLTAACDPHGRPADTSRTLRSSRAPLVFALNDPLLRPDPSVEGALSRNGDDRMPLWLRIDAVDPEVTIAGWRLADLGFFERRDLRRNPRTFIPQFFLGDSRFRDVVVRAGRDSARNTIGQPVLADQPWRSIGTSARSVWARRRGRRTRRGSCACPSGARRVSRSSISGRPRPRSRWRSTRPGIWESEIGERLEEGEPAVLSTHAGLGSLDLGASQFLVQPWRHLDHGRLGLDILSGQLGAPTPRPSRPRPVWSRACPLVRRRPAPRAAPPQAPPVVW